MIKNNLQEKIMNNYKSYRLSLKNLEKLKLLDLENKKQVLENIENFKYKIHSLDMKNIDVWDYYKKKYNIKKKTKFNEKKTKKIKKKFISIILNNLMIYKTSIKMSDFKVLTYLSYNNIFKNLLILNYSKISKNIFKNCSIFKKNLFLILDIRKLKTNITIHNKQKCLLTLTNGLVYKKLNLKSKKSKKSEKISFITLKMVLNNIVLISSKKNIIIQIKGVKKYTKTLLNYVKKVLDNKCNNITLVLNNNFSNNNYFKFKKIKAIKRRLRKKLAKY